MSSLDRRQLLAGLAAASLAADSPRPELIREENKKPGTTDWQLTYTRVDPKTRYRCTHLEGYAGQTSVRPGDRLDLFVSANPAGRFVIDFYRLGYYQGKGGRHLLRLGPLPGKTQPTPPVGKHRIRECAWERSTSLEIPRDWLSGVYLGKLTSLDHRYQSYIIFIVRDDRPAHFLFQCSDNTWQAYNAWPDGYSLYHNDRPDRRPLVSGIQASFNRPYGKYVQIYDNPLSHGSGEFLLWEFPLAFWMEQQGYDVTYCSNLDVHTDLKCLLRARAFLSVGHDEYWSRTQFDHCLQAVKAGVNFAFLSGNTCCFVTDITPSSTGVKHRTLERVGRYGGIRKGEEKYMADLPVEAPNEATLIGAQTVSPFNGSGDWTCIKPEHWLFAGTGMKKGDSIPGLVGWEFHGNPAKIPGLEVVAAGTTLTSDDRESHYTATLYPGPKGNLVFNASTIWWAQGLAQPPGHMPPISHHGRPHGPDERVQRITRNLFERFLA
ncbi:MAG: DUF6605 domain-containing protein [Gemmataceae bacterium]